MPPPSATVITNTCEANELCLLALTVIGTTTTHTHTIDQKVLVESDNNKIKGNDSISKGKIEHGKHEKKQKKVRLRRVRSKRDDNWQLPIRQTLGSRPQTLQTGRRQSTATIVH